MLKKTVKIFYLTIAFFVMTLNISVAQEVVSPMSPVRLVNDYAGLFSARQIKTLEDSLVAFDNATSTQIVVVTVGNLNGYSAGDYALKVGREWGVGGKVKNNGVVLLLKPNNQYGRGQVYISTGYGVEGAMNDAKAGRIIDVEMMPSLRKQDYYSATVQGTQAIRDVLRGEYNADRRKRKPSSSVSSIFMLIGIIIFFIVSRKANKRNKNGDDDGDDGYASVFLPPIFFGSMGGFGGGGSSSGGGGFGGFGGGGFGGGGAGRSF